jgi:hypothetical protein
MVVVVVVLVLVVVPVFESPKFSAAPEGPSLPESLWSVIVDTGLITVVRCEPAVVVGVVDGATG